MFFTLHGLIRFINRQADYKFFNFIIFKKSDFMNSKVESTVYKKTKRNIALIYVNECFSFHAFHKTFKMK